MKVLVIPEDPRLDQYILDAEAHGRVTLERKDMPLREVLDAVCAQAGCVWSLTPGGQRPQLSMMRKKS